MSKYKYAYIDADVLAYQGAAGAESTVYQWVKNDGSEKSPEFKKALEASEFAQDMEMCGENMEEWTREKFIKVGTEADAKKSLTDIVEAYMDTAKQLTENDSLVFIGYLTASGTKTKDIKGLENRYQFNRDDIRRPEHLQFCRKWMIDNIPWMKFAAKGFEADSHVIAKCEQKGHKAVGLFIDKDLAQMENGSFIDMNRPKFLREITKTTSEGELYIVQNARGKEQVKGHGFKWLCFQAIVGDSADGYKGLNGIGEKRGYEILKDTKTKQESMKALLTVYEDKLSKGLLSKKAKEAGAKPEKGFIKYISWDGKRCKLSPVELLNQHLFLAYQERGSKDSIDARDYL